MSITKSYNKHTDTYYAYDTTYVWDEKSQRKIQKKVCVGKYDKQTGEVIPNAKRGRPSKQKNSSQLIQMPIKNSGSSKKNLIHELSEVVAGMNEIESSIGALNERFSLLKERMISLCQSVSEDK